MLLSTPTEFMKDFYHEKIFSLSFYFFAPCVTTAAGAPVVVVVPPTLITHGDAGFVERQQDNSLARVNIARRRCSLRRCTSSRCAACTRAVVGSLLPCPRNSPRTWAQGLLGDSRTTRSRA